jgi:hypothetical protein
MKLGLLTLLLACGALSMDCATREPKGRPDIDTEPALDYAFLLDLAEVGN